MAERRARLGFRHHLAEPAPDLVGLAGALVGIHPSDPATVALAAQARLDGFAVADLERILYDDRALVRIVGMRKTLFVVPVELARVIGAAANRGRGRPTLGLAGPGPGHPRFRSSFEQALAASPLPILGALDPK